jgi:hypothetical protein
MTALFEKLGELRRELHSEQGPFVLFGLFLPEDAAHSYWDFVVSASWLPDYSGPVARMFFKRLQEKLTTDELLQINRVVILQPGEPLVRSLEGLTFRGKDLELGQGRVLVAPVVRRQSPSTGYIGGVLVMGPDWVELPPSLLNGVRFERVVLFYYDPALIAEAQAAPAGAR